MRYYEFGVHEITAGGPENLSLEIDPKLAWALRHRAQFPVDLNRAPRHLLLRVPGLGVKTVDRILQARRWHTVRLADLLRMRVALRKVLPFIETPDHRPRRGELEDEGLQARLAVPAQQLELFGGSTAGAGPAVTNEF